MTTRNLNRNWLDVISAQYKQDYSDSVQFPVRYLLHNPQHNADLYYEVSKPIDPALFKKSLIDFHIYTRAHGYRQFEDENIKLLSLITRPQLPLSIPSNAVFNMLSRKLILALQPLLLLSLRANAWVFTVYPDSECESTPSGSPSGTGDQDCTATPANHRSFELSNMGSCEIYLAATMQDCEDEEFQQFYGAGDEGTCIPPDFQWDAYTVDC